MGSPWIVTVAPLCLSVPKCPYPSPQGRACSRPRAKHKTSAHPWPSAPILRSCHTFPQLVGSHHHVLASREGALAPAPSPQ